jgi:subtilisin family serine protease
LYLADELTAFGMNFRILFSTILLSIATSAFSQSIVDPIFEQQLYQAQPGSKFKALVFLRNSADLTALATEFQTDQTPVNQRAVRVLSALKFAASSAQAPVLEFIRQWNLMYPQNEIIVEKQFHIINAMVLNGDIDFYQALAYRPEIEWFTSVSRFAIHGIAPVEMTPSVNRSVGSHEPGLEAIHAPFLWNLGYTGLGRKLYTVDTGVWPIHPAISHQWLGNNLPQNQVWYGFDSEVPADKSDAHGTHVTGICLGLDPETADTIGVAFGAKYMAADPIVEDVADIKPLPEILGAFEFALNPDGDDQTTDDLPDVICNSWGIGDSIFEGLCTAPFVVDLMSALDLAGIAVEFSAGNEGPGVGTIGLPQYVTIDSLSIFTVGALDANNSNLTIAGFSSRGPTSCDVPDQWKIKPEVSAPGVNVRSSVQWDQYANYSGTSMAGPHVAGSVLILKEAFPLLAGREILNALYQSATDLGDPGEDNTYGKGIINLEAAYNFLSLTNTPVPPNTSQFDIEISKILIPDVLCSGDYTVEVELHNSGSVEFGGGQIELFLDGNQSGIATWSDALLAGQSTVVTVANVNMQPGTHEILAKNSMFSDQIERELINNSRVKKFQVQGTSALPFAESFESNDLSENGLFIRNPDYNRTWDTINTAGLLNSHYSARMQFLSYARKGQWDDIYLPTVEVPANADSFIVRFDYAYRFRNATLADTMEVAYSDDCGNTWNAIFRKGGEDLSTIDTLWTNFKPFNASHWQKAHLNILPLLTGSSVMLRFSGNNRGGSNLFLDNIGIYSETDPTGIELPMQVDFDVMPNPAHEFVQIKTHSNLQIEQVDLRDMQGRLIFNSKTKNTIFNVDISSLKSGVYFIEIQTQKGSATKKLIVAH